ncbi:MAG: isoprenylcysteine carboxylmethyltransferase family protein [Desulfitobacteriaceae bacterium]|nr:isoprenylcysteine carboxylmethyltransferase family protein [Desulfitobacteriaceae bacterium]
MQSAFLIFFACVGYCILHSFLASLWFKDRVRGRFGENLFRWYRLLYNLISGVTFLPILALLVWLPDRLWYIIPFPFVLVSSAIQLVSIGVMGLGLAQSGLIPFLGLDALFGNRSPSPNHLTLDGLYGWVRHPIYTAGLVFLWLMPLMTQNLFAFKVSMSLYFLIGAWLEERKMVAQLGEAYLKYQQQVPMFIPRWRGRGG